jgi:hypothetical protein
MSGDTRREAYEYYISKGWSPQAAAAIVGGGLQESRLDPGAVGDKGSAYGAFQWRNERRLGLLNFAKAQGQDPRNLSTQLAYHDWELREGPERKWGAQLQQAPDLQSAVAAHISSMRPQGWTAQNPMGGLGFSNRYNNAASLLGVKPQQGYTGAGTGLDSPRERNGAKPGGGLLDTLTDIQANTVKQPTLPPNALMSGGPDKLMALGTGLLAQAQPKPQQAGPLLADWNDLFHAPGAR